MHGVNVEAHINGVRFQSLGLTGRLQSCTRMAWRGPWPQRYHAAMAQRLWTRDELLIAFSLYCRLPFGQYDQGNADVVRVAQAIGRTPSAVAMRLSNFASLDPVHQRRGIKGLGSTGPTLVRFWQEVTNDWTRTAVESEEAWERGAGFHPASAVGVPPAQDLAARMAAERTETWAEVKVRTVQTFFRRTVLASYGHTCAMCGIRPASLLTAGHIIPWSQSEARRADPTNGLCLCALHDRAFDQGLIGMDEDLRVMVSRKLEVADPSPTHQAALLNLKGRNLTLPSRYHPDPKALEWHRERVFTA